MQDVNARESLHKLHFFPLTHGSKVMSINRFTLSAVIVDLEDFMEFQKKKLFYFCFLFFICNLFKIIFFLFDREKKKCTKQNFFLLLL